ncbi:uncharacterized protein SPAPADRAFT_73313 [Spathaspora passalidarum NRRL Y-27907]|uniref:Uncharacterized protein n=1 Tax=Spathaspora passalidarum (strain NRRL Y-27907 / 11-Y1) TaxID=619300 RepID=G3AUZ1_SPAPN|nr:uncharacterized protein SPAPADRAFT_73313 [Spathaspora passalidarum NRRL Y-27907]EGW29848.1 hypothetical protein SPAPADRAFT_73313 [Spathaspora passalidarum NRRL Y-27907]
MSPSIPNATLRSLAARTKFLQLKHNSQSASINCGPSDLVHRAIYAGSRSALYHHLDFKGEKSESTRTVDDDGYVGYYHYVNGIRFEALADDIEEYVVELLALKKNEEGKRDIIVSYCSYNMFHRSDFRARFVIQPASAGSTLPVTIDKSYQVIPIGDNRKTVSYNNGTINQLSPGYWEELRASHLIRLFHQIDNPESQLAGTVNYTNFIDTFDSLITSVKILIKYLPRASMSGTRAGYGTPTACGNKGDLVYKTSHYRNKLVDALLRLVSLDLTGEIVDIAISEIRQRFYQGATNGPYDYVILRLLKNKRGGDNGELEYLALIHSSINYHGLYTTQSGLILLDQVNFLICKNRCDIALPIAKKCVLILPLDFDCWYYLALCYILTEDYSQALLVINSLPVNIQPSREFESNGFTGGIKDFFINSFLVRLNHSMQDEEVISEKSFNDFFPNPKVKPYKSGNYDVDEASISKMWHDLFLFNPHLRHPIVGHYFAQSSLVNSSPLEIASVDTALIKIYGPGSVKNALASQSEGVGHSSMTKFMRKSVWGRSYDLLSMMIAVIGWDEVIALKEKVFKRNETEESLDEYTVDHSSPVEKLVQCEPWLEQLFVIIYEDLRVLMISISNNQSQQRSALEWAILGSIGWNVKYNLRESISSIVTSVIGANVEGGFDYFGIVQLLEIYDEFVLSDVNDSFIDVIGDDYDGLMFSNKMILKCWGKLGTIDSLVEEYLSLDFVLLCMIKLLSWNVRWYQYVPDYRIIKVLTKLLVQYDSVYIMTRIKIIFEQNKKHQTNKRKFSLGGLLKSKVEEPKEQYEFDKDDTIFDYMERVINWIDSLKQ